MFKKSSRWSIRGPVYGALAAGLLLASGAQAFPSLNLSPGTPDIESSFITVDYVGDSTAGTLTASGFANVLTPPGSPSGNVAGGSFNISATINETAVAAAGSLTIGGTIAALGFTSGTLLTATLRTLGAGTGDPLEFLFDVTGGDAATLFGPTAGVILSQSGFTGSFASNFTSGAFQALADTFGVVTEPAPFALMLLGAGVVAMFRRRRVAPAALA